MPSSNKVTITCPQIRNIIYLNGSFRITPNEAYELPPNIAHTGAEWMITNQADRKGSEGVADEYVKACGGVGHLAADGGGDRPDKLNFFYGVNLEFDIGNNQTQAVTVYLGQGHYGTTNNWWFGGINYQSGSSILLVIVGDKIVQQYKVKLNTSSFTLTLM